MYLKGIEVQGFKSFANKMKFEFHNGITCIVGPNGSGKSNVADAVRWVLGEQRAKQLRGSNMQDVIFSGTEMRKPQGFASVSLILDNSDHQLNIEYDEVTVTRRVYRSGESEYLINGNNCRLRDINELFYDTGIGKEGYSIIGQGQIDRILSSKPEDRRELFDEAAGIVKFKHRKNAAVKKLDDEQANMQRVSDIMNELERQVGPLARQSETAKTYLRLRDELKGCELSLFCVDEENYEKQSKELAGKLETVNSELDRVKQEESDLKVQYEDVDREAKELENQITSNREEISKGEVLIKELEGQISLVEEQIRSEENSAENSNRRLAQIKKELEDREMKHQELFAKIINLSKEITQKNEELAAAKEKLEKIDAQITEADDVIANGKGRIIELLNEKNDNSVNLQRFETMKEQAQIRRAELTQKLLVNKTTQADIMKRYEAKREEYEAACEQETYYTDEEAKLNNKNRELSDLLHKQNQEMEAKQQAYHASSTKAESLKNIAERYEGYGNSIRKIMEVKDTYKGVHGAVADIIKVNKEYEVAIETALGGSIQNIVTETEQVAKNLVEYLKKNRFGRATFLPLDGIAAYKSNIPEGAEKENGVIGIASRLVTADAIYERVVNFLLGRVLVVDQIDHALAIARKYRYSIKIVTVDGELLNPGGSISGGAFKNNSNLLGRKREIEELEAKTKEALKQYDELLEKQKEIRKQRDEVRRQLEDNTKLKQENAILVNRLTMEMFQLDKENKAAIAEYTQFEEEAASIETQVLEIKEESQKLKDRIDEIDQETKSSEESVNTRSENIEEMKRSRERAQKKVSDLAIETSGITQKEEFYQDDRERISQEIEQFEEEAEAIENGRKDISGTIRRKNERIEELQEQIEETKKNNEALSADMIALSSKRESRMQDQKAFFDKNHELSEQINLLNQEQMRLEAQSEKLEEKNASSVEYLWTEYELLPSEARKAAKPIEGSVNTLRQNISELKVQIKKLGNVNINAIEDFKEVQERYTFMKTQYDDLLESEAALKDVINELDEGMRKQFAEKFAQIKTEFNIVFKELFGGGNADLELVEDADIIEAGIRINAQPPGKKLQNMMQLSGGEKALTAISLLFAIQNLKPSPFCLLDEIEAALDDSNVSRYAQYLSKLTEHTQFILITHRRGTMAAADRLYGITMQEKGVSTLVSVNMIEDKLDQ